MTKTQRHVPTIEELRKEAEARLINMIKTSDAAEDSQRLVQELQIHQVELEMQNEELLRTNFEAEMFSSRYSDLFEFAPIGLFILDKLGIIKDLNINAHCFFGETKKQMVNKRFQAFLHPSYIDSFYFFLQHVLNSSTKQSIELKITKKNGTEGYVILESRKLLKDRHADTEILIALVDISERKNAAEALLKAHKELDQKVKERTKDLEETNEALKLATAEKLTHAKKIFDLNLELIESEKKLKELNESKDKFFAIIAHDLRSPFAGLMGYSKLLAAKADTLQKEEIIHYANSIYTYASNFEKLVNDLLSWSHLQIGHFTYEPKAIKVCEIIDETVEIFSVNVEDKGITVSTDCQACPLIFADENMVKSIFRNLLSNAIKFTNKGGKIEMCTEEKDNEVLIRISDDGVGMTDRIKKRLFKIDQQAVSIGTAKERGNGLGLILVKEFVEKHGGKIWFESEVGKGTTFYLTLPLTISE